VGSEFWDEGGEVVLPWHMWCARGGGGLLAVKLVLGTSLELLRQSSSLGDSGTRDGSTKKIIDFCLD